MSRTTTVKSDQNFGEIAKAWDVGTDSLPKKNPPQRGAGRLTTTPPLADALAAVSPAVESFDPLFFFKRRRSGVGTSPYYEASRALNISGLPGTNSSANEALQASPKVSASPTPQKRFSVGDSVTVTFTDREKVDGCVHTDERTYEKVAGVVTGVAPDDKGVYRYTVRFDAQRVEYSYRYGSISGTSHISLWDGPIGVAFKLLGAGKKEIEAGYTRTFTEKNATITSAS